ncbi:MAG: hypothetical protein VX589_13420 [Myxococcota bacterium]|nr:hypothetical protein [Myxococcota bacterium]
MKASIVLWTIWALACSGTPSGHSDADTGLEANLRARLMATLDPDRRATSFSATANASAFPLSATRAIHLTHLRRIQSIDGRILADYALKDGNEPKVFTVWFVDEGGHWLIDGWTAIRTPQTRGPTSNQWLSLIPGPLVANALRGRAREMIVPMMPAPISPPRENQAGRDVQLRLNIKANPACGGHSFRSQFERKETAFKRCYLAERSGQPGRQGRLTVDIVTHNANQDATITLRESTLLDQALSACVLRASRAALTTPQANCIATVRFTFKPAPAD